MIYSKIEGSGFPLLIIHGYLGMSDNWKSFASQFAQKGFQVHALDMRNHGRSFHSDNFSYTDMVADVKEYVKTHQLDKIVILGHSMGGKVAMNFSINYPEFVEKLIVVDIAPKYYKPHHQDILNALQAVDFSIKPTRKEVEEILITRIPEVSTRQFLMKNLFWLEPGQLAFRFNLPALLETQNNIGEALLEGAQFSGPTLFIKGEQSDYILEDDLTLIQSHFPNSNLVEINNAGHWVQAEKPQEFEKVVDLFLLK